VERCVIRPQALDTVQKSFAHDWVAPRVSSGAADGGSEAILRRFLRHLGIVLFKKWSNAYDLVTRETAQTFIPTAVLVFSLRLLFSKKISFASPKSFFINKTLGGE